jgi:hypothetical protein
VNTENVLVVALVINAVLFVVEAGAGLLAHSTALHADSRDMPGDSLVMALVFTFRSDDLNMRSIARATISSSPRIMVFQHNQKSDGRCSTED